MAYRILSGKEPAQQAFGRIKEEVISLGFAPMLAIVLVGEYKPSEIYVNKKRTKGREVGVNTEIFRLPETASEQDVLKTVQKLNADKKVHGIIVQTPLPKHVNARRILDSVAVEKDVDGFHANNMGKLMLNSIDGAALLPATPSGIMKMLEYYGVSLEGKNAVVIGRSNIVGKPVAMMMLHKNATVTICHTHTKEIEKHTRNAEVLVVAAGSPGMVKADMVKEGAYVIDVGTTWVKENGKEKLAGDVDFENVIKKAHCSPVPGGVGQMTVAMLISNTIKAAKMAKL